MDKSVPIIRINGQRGLSLVQVMIALFVFALGFLPIIRMMGGSGVATAKSRWMIIATNIARGEIDRLKRAEFDSMVSPSQAEHPSKSCDYIGQWKPVVDEPLLPALDSSILKSTRDGAINGLPPEYAKFEKKVDLVEIDYNSGSETSPGGGKWRMAKAVIRVRWPETLPKGEEVWRQMNFPLLIPNTRLYIYQN